MNHILVVEDDEKLRNGLVLSLSSNNQEVKAAPSIKSAKELLKIHKFDLLILDCNLPDGNGIEFCREISGATEIPIIFLTVNDTEIDIVSAFRVGATDYVTKPFSIMVLRERVKAALRRNKCRDDIYKDDYYYFNFTALEYKIEGVEVILSVVEQKIIKLLVCNKNKIIPRERLIDLVWSCNEEFIDDNALTMAIKRLRFKIGNEAIKTVYGLGYMWVGKI
ncbi:response regulator transcription factor [Lachnoclostridium phytofermentans]|uniref:Stage 0 sporulation protein A homolog n=1 Tax=Lachnoclostridium phytofermentans (strain ATCC 700394 / DSM 18823 / ISDg) TaxID=357809 RepID=A9KNL8_LACP7|nr:response regulator transcription factor [Lachnoclostridium phytofermentans]ABX41619.1 two component transcriptional regulator, winged helix family [Lachnoclostridium phytofermentans ISDg]